MKNGLWLSIGGILMGGTLSLAGCHPSPGASADWPAYGGNKENNRYSTLKQISSDNVKDLRVAWRYDSEDSVSDDDDEENNARTGSRNRRRKHPQDIQCQPIVVKGILYGTNDLLKLFALDAATGKQLWKFDPFKGGFGRINQCRGILYWENGDDRRIFYTAGSDLFAVNASTGQAVSSFGTNGKLSLFTGMDINHEVKNLFMTATSPGIVYKNILIMGNTVSEAGDAAPGYVRGFDAITGKLIWTFHTVPQPGEPGYETWPKDAYKWVGGTNNWGGLSLDEKRGVVYFGTGSPSSDFYGGGRPGLNLFSDCIIALDATTGKMKWYYQTVHHDLWDRDVPCPPNLVAIRHDGKLVDVVVQVMKDGNIYVLDRDSGRSVFPVEEKPVPTHGLPGEQPWPVQRFPVKPLPLCKQVITDSDITDLSPQAHAYIQNIFRQSEYGQNFLPPSVKGTILVGYSGGAEWGGNAIDSNGILYQNSNNAAWLLKMVSMADQQKEIASLGKGQGLYITNCSACHGVDRKGNGHEIPSLIGIGNRFKAEEIAHILATGQGRMPSFQHTLSERDRETIINFLETWGRGGVRVVSGHNDSHGTASAGGASRSGARGAPRDVSGETSRGAAPVSKKDFPYIPPYISKVWEKLEDSSGYPGIKPPWGTLNAIDLNTGDYLWRVPLGEYPELTKKGVPVTGTESYGGPLATAGGLVFIAGTRDEKIRAFDQRTGKQVWEYQLPAGGFATPITYEMDGKQYIVIAACGGRGLKGGGSYIAFALADRVH